MSLRIKKLLVANRGEIAVRIFATCKRLGIDTVAVYSDADAGALHVRSADTAVRLGPAPARDSYLNQAAILAAAKATGADAIHPGYGFLSENAAFAEAVIAAGLIWVGPSPAATRALGLKDEAKRIAEEAGVPVLPGYRGAAQDLKTLSDAAKSIGYPLLIKAIAGGGGRGIRLVTKAADLKAELESAQREAASSFGDARVMLEKLVERPRHIEVQVFGDAHGEAVHLFERDCSLQRRRQKVVEEAPAPNMPEPVRAAMCTAAVKLAKAVGYQGAGTVEFIVDGTRALSTDSFWFLEMNTRLQVEHPVTEMITGLDLVEWQLRLAGGEKLPRTQADITHAGHAIEVRLCAEDPAREFRPGAGRIRALEIGAGAPSGARMRADFGFVAGDSVPPDYDSMIGKLIVHAPTRAAAIIALRDRLENFRLYGVPSNAGFLRRCLALREFEEGTHHVNLIGETGAALAHPPGAHITAAREAAARALMQPQKAQGPWACGDGFRMNAPARRLAVIEDETGVHAVELHSIAGPVATRDGSHLDVTLGANSFSFRVPDYLADAEALIGGDTLKSPMPGKIAAVNVKIGDSVLRGQTLVVMEAMKMEHSLNAPRDGVIEAVNAAPGQQVAEGIILVALVAES